MTHTRNEPLRLALIVMGVAAMTIFLFAFLYVRMLKFDFDEKKAALGKEIAVLREEAEVLRSSMDEKSQALAAVEQEKRAVESELQSLKDDNEKVRKELTDKLEELERKKTALKKRIQSLESGSPLLLLKDAAAQAGNDDIKTILRDALRRVELVEQGKPVDLEPIVVGTREASGMVVSADRRNNLVVINLGRKNGLAAGDRIRLYDCDTEIASAEILSTRYLLSAAFVSQYTYGHSIRNICQGLKVVLAKK